MFLAPYLAPSYVSFTQKTELKFERNVLPWFSKEYKISLSEEIQDILTRQKILSSVSPFVAFLDESRVKLFA